MPLFWAGGSVWGSVLFEAWPCVAGSALSISHRCISFLPCFPAALWPCPALHWVQPQHGAVPGSLPCDAAHNVGTSHPVVSASPVAGAANNLTCFLQHSQIGRGLQLPALAFPFLPCCSIALHVVPHSQGVPPCSNTVPQPPQCLGLCFFSLSHFFLL